MEEKEKVEKEEKKSGGIKEKIGIVFGIFLILLSLIMFSDIPFQSILLLFAGSALIPAVDRKLKTYVEAKDSVYGFSKKCFIVFAILVFFVGIPSSNVEQTSSNNLVEQTNEVNVNVENETKVENEVIVENIVDNSKEIENLLSNTILEKDKKIEELENTVLTRDNKISELEDTVTNKVARVTELEESVNTLTKENKDLESKVEESKKVSSSSSSSSKTTSTKTTTTTTTTNNSYTVYTTNTGSKYHRAGCSYLKSSNPISKSDAISQGYSACSRCNP